MLFDFVSIRRFIFTLCLRCCTSVCVCFFCLWILVLRVLLCLELNQKDTRQSTFPRHRLGYPNTMILLEELPWIGHSSRPVKISSPWWAILLNLLPPRQVVWAWMKWEKNGCRAPVPLDEGVATPWNLPLSSWVTMQTLVALYVKRFKYVAGLWSPFQKGRRWWSWTPWTFAPLITMQNLVVPCQTVWWELGTHADTHRCVWGCGRLTIPLPNHRRFAESNSVVLYQTAVVWI